MNRGLVSVIMAAYRESPAILEQAMRSILDQTYSYLEFIIILDDPDNIELDTLITRYSFSDDRIRYERNSRNIGLAQSLNIGISLARGEYICRMDADDISDPDRITSQLQYISDEHLDLIGGFTEVINEHGELLYVVDSIPIHSSSVAKGLQYNNCVPHPTWFGKKETFEMGYRSIPLCEDFDFLIRSSLQGKLIGNCPKIVLKYRMSSNSLSRGNLYKQFLYQQALTHSYRNGVALAVEDAEIYVDNHYSSNKAVKYAMANKEFNLGLSCVRRKMLFRAARHFIRIPVLSRGYLSKIYRLIRVAFL